MSAEPPKVPVPTALPQNIPITLEQPVVSVQVQEPVGPLPPGERDAILGQIRKAITSLQQNAVVFGQEVEASRVPEVGMVFQTIAEESTEKLRQLQDLEKAVQQEERTLRSEPQDLNMCFNRALGIKRSLHGAQERLTVDLTPESLAETGDTEGELVSRARDTIRSARDAIRDTPCLYVRDKVGKLRVLDQALGLVNGGSYQAAAELLNNF